MKLYVFIAVLATTQLAMLVAFKGMANELFKIEVILKEIQTDKCKTVEIEPISKPREWNDIL